MIQRILPLVFLTTACGGSQPPPEPPPAEPPPEVAAPPPAPATAEAQPPAEPAKPAALTPVVRYTEGLSTPESVLYDEPNDRYLVSNIDGSPSATDNNGFIAELSPDGKVATPKLIAGGSGGVKLDAPKGMAIHGGILYVSDISTVRKFDAKTGKPKGEVKLPGATFANDVAATADGRIFVSDSGIRHTGEAFEPTGTDAVYVIEKGKLKTVAKSKDLAGPNGILPTDTGVLTVTFNSNELYRLDAEGAKQDVTQLPQGGLDGIIQVGDKLLVTSWKAQAIFRGTLKGTFEPVIEGVSGPADIGYDSKRGRALVPRFLDSVVEVYELK
jgi:hypothetical protein